jgi:hypothetical protein
MKIFVCFCFSLYFYQCYYSQIPTIDWAKCYGGGGFDRAYSFDQTIDNGYVVAGYSNSDDIFVTGNHGGADYWIVKLDSTGNIIWQKSLGGSGTDVANSIRKTSDGGYIIAGESESNNGDVTVNLGGIDAWIVKLDSAGNITWQKSFGGVSVDKVNSIQQTSDGGYIFAGYTASINGNVNYWIVKLDIFGNMTWQKSFGGFGSDQATSIEQTFDEGYIVAGYSYSNNGDVSGNHGSSDIWIVKIDATGNLIWQKSFGGSGNERTQFDYYGFLPIKQTLDGGYIIAGSSTSNDGDVTGNHGYSDFWIVKIDPTGNITWQKSLGCTYDDYASSVQQISNGGYIIAGESRLNDGDVTGNHGSTDFWIVNLDSLGNLVWQKSFGGSIADNIYSIQETAEGEYVCVGSTYSNDGDVIGHYSNEDLWIVKLSEGSLGINEVDPSIHKKLNKIVNIYGQETVEKPNELLFYIYGDGFAEKKIIIE